VHLRIVGRKRGGGAQVACECEWQRETGSQLSWIEARARTTTEQIVSIEVRG
jgi:hypothetical protein